MGGTYRLGIEKVAEVKGHLRASWATNLIKQRNMQFLLNFFRD